MQHASQRKPGLAFVTAFIGALVALPMAAATPGVPLKFGMDVGAVDPLIAAGLKPDYAMLWAGTWLTKNGWGGFDTSLDRMYARGVTPAVQFYYWGADVTVGCIENGCWSASGQIWKNRAGWDALARDLGAHLQGHMRGRPVTVVLETEFNKGAAATYEPFDGYLAAMAGKLRTAYGAAQVVLGFGNWGDAAWGTFDRAAAAANLVGIQGMRASTRDSVESYRGVAGALVTSVQKLSARFGKPVLVTDVALGSYTEPYWLEVQRATVKAIMDRRTDLRNAGAVGLVYRSLYDSPMATTNEYYGMAERSFGLAWAWSRSWKPAMNEWAAGVRAERSLAPPSTASTSTLSASLAAEAEAFGQKTAGGKTGYGGASGGYVWNLWSNGYIAHAFQTGGATHDVRIRAVGTTLAGVAPLMKVDVDGREVFRGTVLAGSLRDYVATTWLTQGAHAVRVSFLNDAYGGGEDRNLLVDKVTLTPR